MSKVKSKLFQSLLDISVQQYGTVTGVINLSLSNGISITDDIAPALTINVTNFELSDEKIKKYYKSENIIPATAQLSDQMAALVAQYEPVPDDSEGGNTTFSREYTFEYAKEFGTII